MTENTVTSKDKANQGAKEAGQRWQARVEDFEGLMHDFVDSLKFIVGIMTEAGYKHYKQDLVTAMIDDRANYIEAISEGFFGDLKMMQEATGGGVYHGQDKKT